QTYLLTFKMASEDPGIGNQSITVDFPSGSSTSAATFSAAPGTKYWTNWESKSMIFLAMNTSVDLRFSATTQFDVGLDDIVVVPVTIPTTITVKPATIAGSLKAKGAVTINSVAGAGGVKVSLSTSGLPAATVPASVTVLAGKTAASFSIATSVVTAPQ